MLQENCLMVKQFLIKKYSELKIFLLRPVAIGGEIGVVKGAKSRLEVSQISAILLDFDYDVNLKVLSLALKVTGQATVVVSGDRVNAQCKAALARAGRGDQVTISDIKTKLVGSDIIIVKNSSPVIYEIQ